MNKYQRDGLRPGFMAGFAHCLDCGLPLQSWEDKCDECYPNNRTMPDPWNIVLGLDLRTLENTRAYRQSKGRLYRNSAM